MEDRRNYSKNFSFFTKYVFNQMKLIYLFKSVWDLGLCMMSLNGLRWSWRIAHKHGTFPSLVGTGLSPRDHEEVFCSCDTSEITLTTKQTNSSWIVFSFLSHFFLEDSCSGYHAVGYLWSIIIIKRFGHWKIQINHVPLCSLISVYTVFHLVLLVPWERKQNLLPKKD